MSMSTFVIGFRPPDEKWKKMKKIYDACEDADTLLPEEVDEFFDGNRPDDKGMEVDIAKATKEWGDESSQGFEVDITKLPKDVKIVRFYNSW